MIDKTTGFPEVPEGFFWQLEQQSEKFLFINLCKSFKETKKDWLGREKTEINFVKVGSTPVSRYKATKENLIDKAYYILKYEYNAWDEPELVNVSEVVGDYPPKKLS